MTTLNLQFLYGQEFWDKLAELIANSKERVFLVSAYIGKKTYEKYTKLIPENVYRLTICRNDSSYIPPEALKIKQEYFHGKIYLIDDTIIIGSQNLYEANKEGEFSTSIETDSFNASLILYQALLKLIEKEPIEAEPVDADFLKFYDNGCPFCGNDSIPDPISLHTCPGYGGDFVSNEDCESYDGDGFCKYCIAESRIPIGDAICCDDSGCGVGISLKSRTLLYHAINPVSESELTLAREYLRLFNFFKKQGIDAVELFNVMGFVGEVYKTTLDRKVHTLFNLDVVQNLVGQLQEYKKVK